MYSVDFNTIIRQYLSTWFAPKRFAWLSALLKPLFKTRDDVFVSFRAEAIELARYGCGSLVLQAILNKAFNTGNNTSIYIVNSDRFVQPVYIFNEDEGYDPLWVYNQAEGKTPLYVYNESEFAQSSDFVVYVPFSIYNSSLNRVRGLVDLYKIAGPNYSIISY
ncbi:hypothetical protein [Pelobium manganitolerans]|uniref:hypothetical protein n=1 Tax=Pelobium manganitolerans TaxID=1842495 RepID=UPI003FA3AE00